MEEIQRFMLENIRAEVPSIGKLGKLSESDLLRICEKVESIDTTKEKCWLWTGTIQDKLRKGHQHGCIWYNKKYVQTHRIMYHNFIEDVPEYSGNGLIVLHKCSHENNGRCINPWHMKLGTHSENTIDALNANNLNLFKSNGGNPMSKLSDEQVAEIMCLKDSGQTQKEVATKYGINKSQVSRYWNGKTRVKDN